MLPQKKYDVFISFRGEDTRKGILAHLREALSLKGISVYEDMDIPRGDPVWPKLAEAIQNSYVAVVIFSEDYASSTWCLRELKLILDCKKNNELDVIPVFYKVKPSFVRKQKGKYKVAFRKHENDRRFDKDEVQEWKRSLTKAVDLAGWDSENERDEAELVKKIVHNVLQKEKVWCPKVFGGLFPNEESYGHIKSLLEDSSIEVRKIGIWGMPGIGKTTLANIVFWELSSKYESSCFLPNVREQSEKHGIDCLREKLFNKLLKNEDLDIGSAKLGTSFVMSSSDLRRLSSKRVLIVLDDVISSLQIDYLVGQNISLGPGSRVIITSRDMDVLSVWVDDTLDVKPLSKKQSIQLFCLKAFKKADPEEGYKEVLETVLSYANGNPSALKVLGSILYSKSPADCNILLRKVKKYPHSDIQKLLKLSFDGLDELQKNIFLDIACFWKGEYIEDLIKLFDELYNTDSAKSEIDTLCDKALITISHRNKVEMQDLIQAMGRKIICDENMDNFGDRSRLWDANDIYNVLKNKKGTNAVKSIIFNVSKCEPISLSPDVFQTMSAVEYLKFYTSDIRDHCNVGTPSGLDSLPNLKFFRWDGCPLKSLPSAFNAENLVELHMPKSHVEKLWDGVQNLTSLKRINLSYCENLTELPDLSRASKLKTMCLYSCSSLTEISSWLKDLNELRDLNMEFCHNLKHLPTNIHLLHLEIVNCRGCSSLQEFSLTSENMIYLSLEETAIERLPMQIWSLKHLRTLILSSSTRFENLPNSPKLEELPNVDKLGSLEGPRRDEPWNLLSLKCLYLNETNVKSLPASIKDLSWLIYLNLKKCKRLRSVPKLPRFLRYLCATDCASLKTVARSKTKLEDATQELYYYNCTNLDQSSRNNIIADAQVRIQQMAIHSRVERALSSHFENSWASICLPGKDIPDWFTYQNPGSSLALEMPSNRERSSFLGYALCLVLGNFQEKYDHYEEINVECRWKLTSSYGEFAVASKFDDNYGQHSEDIPQGLISEHVFIWFNTGTYEMPYSGKLLFDFYGPHGKTDLVIKCGVRLLFTNDHIDEGDEIGSVNDEGESSGSGDANLEEIVRMQVEVPQLIEAVFRFCCKILQYLSNIVGWLFDMVKPTMHGEETQEGEDLETVEDET